MKPVLFYELTGRRFGLLQTYTCQLLTKWYLYENQFALGHLYVLRLNEKPISAITYWSFCLLHPRWRPSRPSMKLGSIS